MKFTLSASLSMAMISADSLAPKSGNNNAKAVYVSNLLRKAKVVRELNQGYATDVDISGYSVKFVQCQLVRSFDDNLAQDESSLTVLGTSRFTIFRLCPNDDCDNCDEKFGEYIIDMQSYLDIALVYFEELQQETCNSCGQWCDAYGQEIVVENAQKPESLDCGQCVDECALIQNMESNGYVDALQFRDCVKIYDDGQVNGLAYYAAPACIYNGAKIRIGVFSDEYCTVYEKGKDVEDYLEPDGNGNPRSLSNLILQQAYKNTCISCREHQDYKNENDAYDADEVLELCEDLYNYAGKCEHANGFQSAYVAAEGYENQRAQEQTLCKYINSLKAGTYDEYGEINLSGESYSYYGSGPTNGQRFALTFFVLGTVGLSIYAAVIHSKLNKYRRRHRHATCS